MTCVICQDGISEVTPIHTLECLHTFHAKCVVGWFRSPNSNGACPLCRDGDTREDFANEVQISWENWREEQQRETTRVAHLRRKARGKNAPARLKRLVANVQAAEETQRVRVREVREFLQGEEWRNASATCNKRNRLKRLRWSAAHRVQLRKRRLAEYDDN